MPMQRTRTHLLAWFIFSISLFILNESNLVHLNNSFLYSQELQSTLILKKGNNWIEIKPGEKVYIRSYRKTFWGKRKLTDIPERSIIRSGPITSPTTIITIDHQQKVLITETDAIALSDLYSISLLSGGKMTYKAARNGVVNGFCSGFAASFLFFILLLDVDIGNEFPELILLSSILGGVSAAFSGVLGLVYGSFIPDILEEFIIGPGEWIIVEE